MENPIPPASTSRSALLAGHIKRDWWWVTICLVVFCTLLSLFRDELSLQRLDLTIYDFQSSTAPTLAKPTQTSLIIIDDKSLDKIGYWPWRRVEYARALDFLGQAKAVGLDIVFQDHNPSYPADESFLAYSIATHGRVALPSILNKDQSHIIPPLGTLAEAAAAIGYINVYPDRDGVVRRSQLYTSFPEGPSLHFVPALLKAGNDTASLNQLLSNPLGPTRLISFLGRPGHFDTYSFSDVVEGKISPEVFKDRYVLIGAWSSGLGDFYPTPLSTGQLPSMSGVEILANVLENSLSDNWVRMFPVWVNALFSVLPTVFICIVLRHLTPQRALISTVVVVSLVIVGNWLLLNLLAIWIPPTIALIGSLLSYPVWYWRSQETVLRHINHEISELRAHDPALRLSLEGSSSHRSLPERLSHLHKAIELLREAQQRREETLRFISHDMRAPQNSILALVEMRRNKTLEIDTDNMLNRVESYASTTLELVDNFMDLARVEAMELEFEPVFLNDILVEVCDDAWVRAQSKNIRVLFEEPEHGVWVNAFPPLLKRALSNLIDNAIKYSSENTQIQCLVQHDAKHVILTIKDQGWGIPEKDLPTIFQAFTRAHTDQKNGPTGSGLGLAFVHTVILRHFGQIHVSSKEHIGTTFTIKLPTIPEPV